LTRSGDRHDAWAERYSRQTVLPGFGGRVQDRLAGSQVFLSGDPSVVRYAGLYLTAAGVGCLLVGGGGLAGELDALNDLASVRPLENASARTVPPEGPGTIIASSPMIPGRIGGLADGPVIRLARDQAGFRKEEPVRTAAGGGVPGHPLSAPARVALGCRIAAAVLLELAGAGPSRRGGAGPEYSPWDLAGWCFGRRHGDAGRSRGPRPAASGCGAAGGGHALLVGAGGLGSGAALGIAAAVSEGALGPGFRLTVVDPDVVEQSNLPRQVLHAAADVGRPKIDSAAESILKIAPKIKVTGVRARVTEENVPELLTGVDVVIGAVDNFAARYVLNDACVSLGVPLVEAGVLRFAGLLMLAHPPQGPCYRCLFPVPPAPDSTPDPAAAGVLGPLAGLAGALEAALAVMVLRGEAGPAYGKLLVLDAEHDSARAVAFGRDQACLACAGGGGDRFAR